MLLKLFPLLLFVLLNFDPAQQSSEKKPLPPFKQARLRQIDVKHITLDLRFDWQKKQAFGTAAITFSPLDPTDNIALDAGMLTINSVSLNEKNLKFDYAGGDKNDNLKIALDRVYRTNENLRVEIDYHTNYINEIDPNSPGGSNGKGLRFSKPTTNDPIKPREIWSFGDPESNRYWFPSFDAPNDLRTTEFIATVDKKLTVVSNGKLLETKENYDGTKTFHFKADIPYQNHLTSFVVGEYSNFKQIHEGIELNNFGYEREKDWVAATVERLPEMMNFFAEKTGVKYPYSSYSQAFVQDIGTFSANNSVSTITENMVDDFGTHADFYYLWDLTEGDALAAQWFGNYVSCADWSDVWLCKSFAQYFNGLYNEHRNGANEFLWYQHDFNQNSYHFDWNSGYRRPISTRNYDDAANFTSDNYAYRRGAVVLRLLQKHLGEEKWWKSVKNYVKEFAGKSASTKDFQKVVEESSGEKLDWFFEQWIYKMGHPMFEVSKKYENGKLSVFVIQTQSPDKANEYPQADFFQGKIEIEIDGRIETVWLKPQTETDFIFKLPNPPKFVNFDYQRSWIKEVKFDKSFAELLNQLQFSKDILARGAALTELVQSAKNNKTSAAETAKLKDVLRKISASEDYWRLRNRTMGSLQNLSGANPLDEATRATLISVIKKDKSWTRASAIGILGSTNNPKFADLYLSFLNDPSDRVISAAAIALGKTKSPKAFDALAKLVKRPSMKNQSLLSALSGLKELGDPRGFDIAFNALSDTNLHRWRLPSFPPSWDFRPVAADTIVALGKKEAAFPLIFERFKKSMAENDIDGIFNNTMLVTILADPRGQEVFEMLKAKYQDDANAMTAVNQYETQFKERLKN